MASIASIMGPAEAPQAQTTRTTRSVAEKDRLISTARSIPATQRPVIEAEPEEVGSEGDQADEEQDDLEGEEAEGEADGEGEEGDEEVEADDDDDDVDNFTTSEIVTVYVGPKRKRFFLHRELICDRSPFMEKCLKKGRFDEGITNELYLPEDDPKAFSIIVDWIYRSKIPQKTDPSFDVSDMSSAYGMADKFGMEELQNQIIDNIRSSLSRREGEMSKTPRFEALALIHITGPPKSPLKRFFVEHLVFHMMKHPKFYIDMRRANNEHIKSAMEELYKLPELVAYIMRKIWLFQADNWKDPATFEKCCYHVHSTTVCPAKTMATSGRLTRAPGVTAGFGSPSASVMHAHGVRPGHGGWPSSSLGGVWHASVGW